MTTPHAEIYSPPIADLAMENEDISAKRAYRLVHFVVDFLLVAPFWMILMLPFQFILPESIVSSFWDFPKSPDRGSPTGRSVNKASFFDRHGPPPPT